MSDGETCVDALGQQHAAFRGSARIVSLVPSITELVCDLGLGAQLVGRTGFCIHPRAALRAVPKIGGTKDVKLDAIRALSPTHVIVNIDENPKAVADALAKFVPHVIVTHPCAPEDNRGLYQLLGHVFGRRAEAQAMVTRFDAAMQAARAAGEALPPENVLYLIWRAPWMTVSPATYISATLATVGWMTVPVQREPRYPAFEWDASWLPHVDRVLLSTEPYRFRDKHVEEVRGLCDGPPHLIDGEWTSWYGSRAIKGLARLAQFRRALAAND